MQFHSIIININSTVKHVIKLPEAMEVHRLCIMSKILVGESYTSVFLNVKYDVVTFVQ